MSSIAGGPRLSVNSAAPTATTRLVGQFWGLDSDRVFEFFLRQIVFSQKVDVLPGGRRPIHGKLVGPGDLATQARQVFGNLGRALAAAGARPAQVTRITIYVVNYKRGECLPIIEKARIALFGDHKPADVVLGVATLSPDYLIEVDAIAIID